FSAASSIIATCLSTMDFLIFSIGLSAVSTLAAWMSPHLTSLGIFPLKQEPSESENLIQNNDDSSSRPAQPSHQRINLEMTATAAGSSGKITGVSFVRTVRSPTRFTITFTGHPH